MRKIALSLKRSVLLLHSQTYSSKGTHTIRELETHTWLVEER